MIGTVKWFSSIKGYGFITSPASREDIFVHWTGIASPSSGGEGRGEGGQSFRSLNEGDEVRFEMKLDQERGRQCAANVTVTRPATARHAARTRNSGTRNPELARYPQHA